MFKKQIYVYDDNTQNVYKLYPDSDMKYKKYKNLNPDKLYEIDLITYNRFRYHQKFKKKLPIDKIKDAHKLYEHTEDMDTYDFRLRECLGDGGKSLDISHLDLEELPRNIPSTVQYLYCNNNRLLSVSLIKNLPNLKVIDCSNNQILNISKVPYGLEELVCKNNYIESLDCLKKCKYIKQLDCSYNKICSLPKLVNLEVLICCHNNLEFLPDYSNLKKLYCKHNRLRKLNNFKYLEELECNDNKLLNILSYHKLKSLFCENNSISSIDHLPNITVIQCYNNSSIKFPFFPKLVELICDKDSTKIHSQYKIRTIKSYKDGYLHILFE